MPRSSGAKTDQLRAADLLLPYDKLWSSKRPFPEPAKMQVKDPAMSINEDLLEILACPACKAKVQLKADGSALKCVECKRVYPIRDNIPVMLIDEATIETEDS